MHLKHIRINFIEKKFFGKILDRGDPISHLGPQKKFQKGPPHSFFEQKFFFLIKKILICFENILESIF